MFSFPYTYLEAWLLRVIGAYIKQLIIITSLILTWTVYYGYVRMGVDVTSHLSNLNNFPSEEIERNLENLENKNIAKNILFVIIISLSLIYYQ